MEIERKHPQPADIVIQGLEKSFGSLSVLKGIDLHIRPGESWVIMGGSGSGKSVLLKCLLGLLSTDNGTIVINGRETTHLKGRAREGLMNHFGVLFQGSALFDSLPVWENVAFSLLQRRLCSRTQARDAAMVTLASVGLHERAAMAWPAELSGGMQRRVALARAIIAKPDILLFDEPTAGLDPIISAVINELIRSSTQKLGATAITITHDIQSAKYIADRVAMVHDGRIVWTGSSLENVDNALVDQFIHGRADGPMNVR